MGSTHKAVLRRKSSAETGFKPGAAVSEARRLPLSFAAPRTKHFAWRLEVHRPNFHSGVALPVTIIDHSNLICVSFAALWIICASCDILSLNDSISYICFFFKMKVLFSAALPETNSIFCGTSKECSIIIGFTATWDPKLQFILQQLVTITVRVKELLIRLLMSCIASLIARFTYECNTYVLWWDLVWLGAEYDLLFNLWRVEGRSSRVV